MNKKYLVFIAGFLSACGTSGNYSPETLGETAAAHGYVPLDGLSVEITRDHTSCKSVPTKPHKHPLKMFSDITVRFSVGQYIGSLGISYGPGQITTAGKSYKAVLDYVNTKEITQSFYINKLKKNKNSGETDWIGIVDDIDSENEEIIAYKAKLETKKDSILRQISEIDSLKLTSEQKRMLKSNFTGEEKDLVSIPILVGVGLRMTADVLALESKVSLNGFGTLGAEAAADKLSGTLTVQTIGANGGRIAVALPLPNKLDQTTVENGMLAIGGIRATLYAALEQDSDIQIWPRVVGLFSPVGTDPRLINALYTEIANNPPVWDLPCIS